jgi:serine/threonine-protein kinase RsbW
MRSDVITLSVPARSEYAKTVRMAAAQLATRIGMSYDEVDDVRMAAEEAFVYACGCLDESETVTFTFEVSDEALALRVGPLPSPCAFGTGAPEEGYAEFILRSVCDEFEVEHGEGACALRLIRRIAVPAGDPGA